MELRVIQCDVGKYNLLSSEETLSFSMGIFQDNKVMEQDGVKAKIYYSGDKGEIHDFEDAIRNIEEVFPKCFEYSNGLLYSSTDYRAQCLLFAKLYTEYREALNATHKEKTHKRLQEKIKELQADLLREEYFFDISETINWCINKEIKKYKGWIDSSTHELSQLKEDSEKYTKVSEKINGYKAKIATLESNLVPQPEEE